MLLFTRTTLQLLTGLMHVVDWIVDRLDREDDIPEFLRDEYRPLQIAGRPRKDAS